MNYALIKPVLGIALLATTLSACCNESKRNSSDISQNAKAGDADSTPSSESLRKIPADATHCRVGHEYTRDPNDGSIVKTTLIWFIREAVAADFESEAGKNFEIVQNYSNATARGLPFVIDIPDRFTNTVTAGTISVDHDAPASQPAQSGFTAALTMQKFGSADLWAQGRAIPKSGAVASGTIAMFVRPDAKVCLHSKLIPSPQPCRRLLIEYFDDKDTLAKQDLPQTSGVGQNIFPVSDDICKKTGTRQETSDGEGHEGPP